MNAKPIKKSVCTILRFEGKILFVKRQNYLRHFPGYISFPGGKKNEIELKSNLLVKSLKDLEPELIATLVRETREELGIDLEELQQANEILEIRHLACAITPDFNPYRFENHYFLVDLKSDLSFSLDESEFEYGKWLTPDEFFSLYNKGEMLTIKPMLDLALGLKNNPDNSWIDLVEFDGRLCPLMEPIKGLIQIMPLSNTLPPATRTNAFLIGDLGHPQILVDPSPKDERELSKFLETLKDFKITEIFITHHHRDHHQFAPELAKFWKVPLLMSQLTHEYMTRKRGEEYLKGCKIKIVRDQDILTKTRGEDVIVVEVPGHDLGQLALMPKDKKWFIAGDLFQGIGTVVVGGPESSMKKYFETLQKVIDLNPHCVVPSHGIALGGTGIIQKNLEHRKIREEQVRQLFEKNLGSDEMLKIIYPDLSERLIPYALANIESHLQKIKEENG